VQINAGHEGEALRLASWRCRQLVRAGFTMRVAARLSSDPRYDLHALIELVERGCPPELAVQILAPLENGVEP
jgi:hypothetical protein